MVNPNRFPESGRTVLLRGLTVLAAGAVALGSVFYAQSLGGNEGGADKDNVPQKGAGEHHPLPWYESDKGPDGRIDFFAHRHTEDGVTSYRIDGGTPAPAAAGPVPQPERTK